MTASFRDATRSPELGLNEALTLSSGHTRCPLDMKMFQHRSDRDDIYRQYNPATRAVDGTVYIFDGQLAAEVLKSDTFRSLDLHKGMLEVERRTGIDFSASQRIFSKLAPVRDGVGHRSVRIELARRMGDLHVPLLRAAEAIIDQVIATKFKPGAQIDLCKDLFFRIYSENARLFSGLSDIDITWAEWVLTTTFAHTSLRTRIKINDDLGAKTAEVEGSDDEAALKMALLILGSEAFTGGFVRSVWEIIERQPNLLFSTICWPDNLPATAAPFVERQAENDWSNNQLSVKKGDIVRVVIGASTPFGPLATENVMFGRGLHSCIGRRYSEDLWDLFIEKVCRVELLPQLIHIETRQPDDFLNFPCKAIVKMHDISH